jgi:hypothetical protein
LVLLSFALVLAATVLLVLGLLNDELTLIYLSIACSAGAAIALIVALRHHPRAAAVDFPIADYDELTVEQILPLLGQLEGDEIGVVEARERATQRRPEILEPLPQLRRDRTEAAEAAAAATAPATPAPETNET